MKIINHYLIYRIKPQKHKGHKVVNTFHKGNGAANNVSRIVNTYGELRGCGNDAE